MVRLSQKRQRDGLFIGRENMAGSGHFEPEGRAGNTGQQTISVSRRLMAMVQAESLCRKTRQYDWLPKACFRTGRGLLYKRLAVTCPFHHVILGASRRRVANNSVVDDVVALAQGVTRRGQGPGDVAVRCPAIAAVGSSHNRNRRLSYWSFQVLHCSGARPAAACRHLLDVPTLGDRVRHNAYAGICAETCRNCSVCGTD